MRPERNAGPARVFGSPPLLLLQRRPGIVAALAPGGSGLTDGRHGEERDPLAFGGFDISQPLLPSLLGHPVRFGAKGLGPALVLFLLRFEREPLILLRVRDGALLGQDLEPRLLGDPLLLLTASLGATLVLFLLRLKREPLAVSRLRGRPLLGQLLLTRRLRNPLLLGLTRPRLYRRLVQLGLARDGDDEPAPDS